MRREIINSLLTIYEKSNDCLILSSYLQRKTTITLCMAHTIRLVQQVSYQAKIELFPHQSAPPNKSIILLFASLKLKFYHYIVKK